MTIQLVLASTADLPSDDDPAWPDRTVGQTPAWLAFVAESQGARPVVARAVADGDEVGWFAGAVVRRGPVRQLGSPLPGWTTAAMGMLLPPGIDRQEAIAALPSLAVDHLRCWHLEVADRHLAPEQAAPLEGHGFRRDALAGFALPLAGRSDDDLLATMTSSGRRDVRRALRNGIEVVHVDPTDPIEVKPFLLEHRRQLEAAFAKRGLRPTYPASRTAALVRHLGPTGHLLLLEARTPEGAPAATGIFVGLPGSTVEFWAGASDRRLQHLLPNEALMWEAIRRWRDRGAATFDFGGGGEYKRKYGGARVEVVRLRWSRWAALEAGRRGALSARRLLRRPRPVDPRN